jgi:hypothetical protein
MNKKSFLTLAPEIKEIQPLALQQPHDQKYVRTIDI